MFLLRTTRIIKIDPLLYTMATLPTTKATTTNTPSRQQDGILIENNTYYQHQEYASSNNSINNSNNGTDSVTTWRITNVGEVREFSRDMSVHATDEVFNAASHLAATMLSCLGTALLVVEASARSEPWKIVSFSIYGAALLFLFGCSTLHHAVTGPWEAALRMLDYLAIYPLIAGTFTPLCLVFYHDTTTGWIFCGTVWFMAIAGMAATAVYFTKIPKWLSMTTYVTLGWLGACMSSWLVPMLGWTGFGLFIFGGVLYTAGGYVYTVEHPNPVPGKFGFHEIWHVAVVLAATCHWMLMYFYVLPWEPLQQ
jgi:hemolysin III